MTTRRGMRWTLIIAVLGGLAYGYAMVQVFGWGVAKSTGMASFAFLVLVPIGIGALTAAFNASNQSYMTTVVNAIVVSIVFLASAAMVYSGMFFCIVIAAPLWLIPVLVGALLVRVFQHYIRNRTGQRVFVGLMVALPLMFAPLETYIPAPDWVRMVEDDIVIDGTPEQVWGHIIRMQTISPDEQRPSLYHTLGVPRPIRATLDREAVGGVRVGEFEYGLTFHEIITVWQPHQAVRFDVRVHTNTRDTDILAQIGGRYFDIEEAGYRIEPLANGQVRLYLSSTYRLSTHFNPYGVLWSDWILHDFQSYVLQTVKARVEREG